MVSDLTGLPPDITSALVYAGPGATSYVSAASAWNAVAAEWQSFALSVGNTVTELSDEEWVGPTSAQMVTSVQRYLQWAQKTAAQAEQTAQSASSAAAAFETVFASVVPPPVIALNRAQLTKAVATNVIGQNNGVISQLEQQYNGYWAQNATALTTYSTASKNATKSLVAPTDAPPITNDNGQAQQAANNASTIGSGAAQKTVSNAATGASNAATPAAQPLAQAAKNPVLSELWFLLTGQTLLPSSFASFVNGLSPFAGFAYNTEGLPYFSVGMGNSGVQIAKSTGQLGGAAASAASAAPKGLAGLGGMLGGGAHAAPAVAAGLGNAGSVGRLSVPAMWSGAAPALSHASAVPVSAISAVPEAAGSGNLLGGMPLAGMGGQGGFGASGPRYGFKPTVMARPPFAG
jgi:PPE-repeat protein